MRVAIGGLWHETNTFSPARTTIEDFDKFQFSEGEEVIARNNGVGNEIGGFIDAGRRLGFDLVPLLFAGALPSATVSSECYQFLRARILDRLRDSLPVDGVLLALHGAMVAERVDDVEMDLLAGVRMSAGATCLMKTCSIASQWTRTGAHLKLKSKIGQPASKRCLQRRRLCFRKSLADDMRRFRGFIGASSKIVKLIYKARS